MGDATKSEGPGGQPQPSQNSASNNAPDRIASAASEATSALPPVPVPPPLPPVFPYRTLAEARIALAEASGSPMEQLEIAYRLVVEGEARITRGRAHATRGHELRMQGLGLTDEGDQRWRLGNRMEDDGCDLKELGEAAIAPAVCRLFGGGAL